MKSCLNRRNSPAVRTLTAVFVMAGAIFGGQVFANVSPPVVEEATHTVPLKYIPNEIIVKFRPNVVDTIEMLLAKGTSVGGAAMSDSLDELNNKYKLKSVKPVFKNFKKRIEQTKALLTKDKSILTKKEKRILARLERAPKGAKVPELDRIYKIRVEPGEKQSLEEVVAAYNNDTDVEYAELNYIVSANLIPNDPLFSQQWALDKIDAPEAWGTYTGNSDIIVAVIDTGVDYRHGELDDNMWVNRGEIGSNGVDDDENGYVDDVYGYDFINDDGDPADDKGHGTHCAGIIAAEGDNELDVAGVCWDIRIMGLKFLDAYGYGSNEDAIRAFYYAVENGADVTSNSWGGGGYSEAMEEAVNYAYSQGVIMVAAAGNEYSNLPSYPADYEHMIGVAATDEDDQKAPFSNYGDWVDIAAPGVSILSLQAGGGTISKSGTSMACPYVAGSFALLLSTNPFMTCDEALEILMETTAPISPEICLSGRLNLFNAMAAIVSSKGLVVLDNDFYSCSDELVIWLADGDLKGNGSCAVSLTTSGGDSETVVLAETTIAVGIFTGTILTALGDATIEDGALQVSHGEIITATYLDSDDGSGNPATASDAAIADCEPPAISTVQTDVPGPEPAVSFETDEPTTARVLCGPTCGEPYIIEGSDLILATSHTIKLIGVSQEKDYFYIVKATDAAGNETVEDNGGQCYAFTTTGPGDIYVPSQGSTIQEAIDDSWDGGTVWVADGTYSGEGNRDVDFKGKAITVRSENGPEKCIIDCGGTEAEPHRGFYFHNGEGQSSILNGFTITNGYIPADSTGGGIRCEGSSPTVTNCTFISNSAGWGGGLYNYESNPTVTDCTFNGNSAENWGGGIENWENSSPMISSCTFTGNTADDGGGICNDNNSSPVLTDCAFNNNSASSNGGGLWSGYSSPMLRNCTFRNNLASGSGGGIYNYESSPTLTNCSFSSNSGNGMSNQSSSVPTLTNCTFIGNSGDGMYNGYRCVPMVTNCTFSGNGGYGMNNLAYNDATVTNCTFSRNSGGVYNRFSTPTLTNCILWSNGGVDESSQIYNDSFGAVVVNYSCIQGLTGALGGTGNIGADPMFVEADGADNEAGTSDDNLRLLGGSACLDAGDNSAVPPSVDEDLDGNPRIRSRTVDMGAYEGPKQGFLLSTNLLSVPEGEVATFTVALAIKPSGSAKVTVAFESGDGDITVESGGLLTFKARDYWKPQTVTLAAAEDEDYFHGAALIWVSASGFATAGVSASELDNDVPRVLYVDGSAGGANDGTSWVDAFGGLQEALSVAAVCPQVEEIHMAQGVYTPAGAFGDREATFELVSGVAVKGGYTGLSKPEPDTRDIDVYETILSGDLNGDDAEVNDALGLEDDPSRSENSYHVVTGSGTDETAVLDGFTITGGNAEGDGGGGMYNDNGSPTITNCRFSGNIGESSGGGMYNWYSDPTLTNCTFSINLATGHYSRGGGMYNYNSNPMLTNCTISENAGGNGGGMYNYWYSSPTLTDCTISSNISITRVGDGGGGIYCNYYSNPTINYCTISNNVATRHGGGIYCRNYSSPTISNCTISGNTATSASISGGGGGGIYLSGGSPMISNCMFIGNTSIWSGGGIYGGSPTVTNCIFSGNSAVKGSGTPLSAGGAMCNCEGSITNCTFVGNSATDQGGGMYNCAGLITNCIIWENRAATNPQLDGSSIPRYSCIQDWTGDLGETGNIDDDPLFIEPGRWHGDKWVGGNYHLQAGSPCIDAGDPTGDYFGQVDIDGEPRVINNRVDIGADEFTTEVSAFLVDIDPDTLNLSSQDQWITCYIRLGQQCDVAEIELSSIKLEEIISPAWTWVSEKKQVVMAKFNRSDIEHILEVGDVTVTVSCELADGTELEGTDTIRVIDEGSEK